MANASDYQERKERVAKKLLEIPNETPRAKWGAIADTSKGGCDKKIANSFLLCCLIDYQNRSDGEFSPWSRGRRYFEGLKEEHQQEFWRMIAGYSKKEWEDQFSRCGLHWRHAPHNRLWQIASDICFFYDGDARRIWEGGALFDALCRLYYLGAGEQISRMIVGALKDSGYFPEKSDVKADVHVCRVLGRIFGTEVGAREAINLTRETHPKDPWRLDWPLWNIGRSKCHPDSPQCATCELKGVCNYAESNEEKALQGQHSLSG
jgi:hypothetical protein